MIAALAVLIVIVVVQAVERAYADRQARVERHRLISAVVARNGIELGALDKVERVTKQPPAPKPEEYVPIGMS